MANLSNVTEVPRSTTPEAGTIEFELAKKSEKRNVAIPEKNLLGWEHPGVGINLQHYEAGKTHLVNGLVADEMERILENYNSQMLQLLQPQINKLVQRKLQGSIG